MSDGDIFVVFYFLAEINKSEKMIQIMKAHLHNLPK